MNKFLKNTLCIVTALFGLSLTSSLPAGTSSLDKSMTPVLTEYLKITSSLAKDSTKGVAEAAAKIGKLADNIDVSGYSGENAESVRKIPAKVKTAAQKLAKADTIETMRDALTELSKPMLLWAGIDRPDGVYGVYCPMKKGSWLQSDDKVKNPYYGAKMLKCGKIVVKPTK